MKFKFFILIIFGVCYWLQDEIVGKYRDNFGSEFKFNSDLTYDYKSISLGLGFWSKGKWEVKNDTIYFKAIPVYDTLRRPNGKDTLILSQTETPKLIIDIDPINEEIIKSINLGLQDPFSGKLFFHNNKLYEIDKNGKLITEKKTRSFSRKNSEKFDPWYTKISE